MVQVVPILLMISGSSYGEFILEVISTKDLIDQANGIYCHILNKTWQSSFQER